MLTANENGFSSFIVPRGSIPSRGDVHYRCNRDSGKSYISDQPVNRFYLGKICAGNTLQITIVTSGFKSVTEVIPYEEDGICYKGHYLPGKSLISENATKGNYIKLSSLDGKMWHVVESTGEWFKDGLT